MIEPVSPVNERVEQEEANHRQVSIRNFGNIRRQEQPWNPSQTQQTDGKGHHPRQQPHQGRDQGITDVGVQVRSAHLLTLVTREQFFEGHHQDEQKHDDHHAICGD